MHAGGQHLFSKSILQLGNGELKSITDGTDRGMIEVPEGIVEGVKIKYKLSLQVLAREFYMNQMKKWLPHPKH
jgi:predicted methyltransferase MtxX (methanogen marker protein 4)